jgi:CubicO group peptidase (beta-lactamase class C family)
MGGMTAIDGDVAAGFEPVRAAFEANFARHEDIGAAVCVYRDGRPVVDLWGGVADPDSARPWARDTLQLVYSATKGATATAAHLLAQRGALDLDAPVAEYWPEFAAGGKAEIPVRWLLSHQAGVVALDQPIPLADALAWEPMVAALAAQRPKWTPGTAHGYHGRTFGWLVGEVIRRVSGRTPGRFFADEIAAPLELDFFIGLPASERGRVSRMVYKQPDFDFAAVPPESIPEEFRELVTAVLDPNSLYNKAFSITGPAEIDFNSPEVQAAEIPASNGIGTARGLARMYASLIGRGGRRTPADPGNRRIGDQGAGQWRGPGHRGADPVRLRIHVALRDQPDDRPGLLRPSWPRRLARLRRPGARHCLRLRNEPHHRGRPERQAGGFAGRSGARIADVTDLD